MTDMITTTLAAALGTAAFSVLFSVPKSNYLSCAVIGGAGWLAWELLMAYAPFSEPVAIFLATVLVVLLSRIFAILRRCPATVFLTTGIFPLVPGAGIYWTSYYLVSGQNAQALMSGLSAVKDAFAIVLGIVFVFEIPNRAFAWLVRCRDRH